MVILQILLYLIALTAIGTMLTFIFGYFTYCEPIKDIMKAITFIRKRSWEK
jgi:hypothetical protein